MGFTFWTFWALSKGITVFGVNDLKNILFDSSFRKARVSNLKIWSFTDPLGKQLFASLRNKNFSIFQILN